MNEQLTAISEQRKAICGDLWPPADMRPLTTLELFDRMRICNRNKNIAFDNAGSTRRKEQSDKDMREWAAWGDAEDVYIYEIRRRLSQPAPESDAPESDAP